MKNTITSAKKNLYAISIFSLLLLANCSKQDAAPTSSTITYSNSTSTPIKILISGQTQIIDVGKSVIYTGKPGTKLIGKATTSGVTTSNTQVGSLLSWPLNDSYPASGNLTTDLYTDANVFFLQIVNNSAYTFTKVYVNYGLVGQSLDNLSIPSDGVTYNIGYYSAYTNTNVRVESAGGGYAAGNISLSFTKNQSYTFSVN